MKSPRHLRVDEVEPAETDGRREDERHLAPAVCSPKLAVPVATRRPLAALRAAFRREPPLPSWSWDAEPLARRERREPQVPSPPASLHGLTLFSSTAARMLASGRGYRREGRDRRLDPRRSGDGRWRGDDHPEERPRPGVEGLGQRAASTRRDRGGHARGQGRPHLPQEKPAD